MTRENFAERVCRVCGDTSRRGKKETLTFSRTGNDSVICCGIVEATAVLSFGKLASASFKERTKLELQEEMVHAGGWAIARFL